MMGIRLQSALLGVLLPVAEEIVYAPGLSAAWTTIIRAGNSFSVAESMVTEWRDCVFQALVEPSLPVSTPNYQNLSISNT
jgi:hypothetical protein